MSVRESPLVSIVIPSYNNIVELTRLCLRAIRRFSEGSYETLVVDNGSTDGSLSYLREVSWIRLLERSASMAPSGGDHRAALCLGLTQASGEFLLVMHTDTIVRSSGWLQSLLAPFADPQLAVVGSDKLDAPGTFGGFVRALGDRKAYGRLWYRLLGSACPERYRVRPPYPRSFCAVYRREVLLRDWLDFLSGRPTTVGEEIHEKLTTRGYRTLILPSEEMTRLVLHIGHATSYLSPDRQIRTGRVRRRTGRRIREVMSLPWVRELLEDHSLDR